MKRLFLSAVYFILAAQIFSTGGYTVDSFLGSEVYFPKTNAKYLEELIVSDKKKSLLELAYSYARLEEFDAAKLYIGKYKEESEEKEYLKMSKVYHLLGEYTQEIFCIEKYLETKPEEKGPYYDYILSVIEEKNLEIPSGKYELSHLDRIFLYENSPNTLIRLYYLREWNEQEYNEIMEFLLQRGVEDNQKLKQFFLNNASKSHIGEYRYGKIVPGDKSTYFRYFEYMEKSGLDINPRDIIEKLYLLNYKNMTNEFSKLYSEVKQLAIEKRDFNTLYDLYLINGDLKILYNLAFENEEYFYRFIEEVALRERNLLPNLLDEFRKNYKDSRYQADLVKIELNLYSEKEKKLEIINNYLKKNFDLELFSEKVSILKELGRVRESVDLIEEHLQYSTLNDDLVRYYMDVVQELGDFEKLISTLAKMNKKDYYFEACIKNGYDEAGGLEKEFLEYNFKRQKLDYLYHHKDDLSDQQIKILAKKDRGRFLDEFRKRSALNSGDESHQDIAYIYFDNAPREIDVARVEGLDIKTSVEYYYLAFYYSSLGQYRKSERYLEKIYKKYSLAQKVSDLRKYNLDKIRSAQPLAYLD